MVNHLNLFSVGRNGFTKVSLSIVGLAALTLLSACQGKGVEPDHIQSCKNPRPEICTMEINPVCGYSDTGESLSYSNACSACANPQVSGYAPGNCPSD